MENLDLNGIAKLPKQFYINIVELKCQIPGVITVLHTPLIKSEYIDFSSNSVAIHNIFEDDYHISCYVHPRHSYIQMINIYGCSTISISEHNTYDCKDFFTLFVSSENRLEADLKNVQNPYLLLTIIHSPNEKDGKKLLIE